MFSITYEKINELKLKEFCIRPDAGGYVSFEGWVRNHNEGAEVIKLEYEGYDDMALRQGQKILSEALKKFDVFSARCEHRLGKLEIGDMAVWVGVSSAHRKEAFEACQYIIDTVKHSLPIWKKEYYLNGDSGWVNCEACAAAGEHHHH